MHGQLLIDSRQDRTAAVKLTVDGEAVDADLDGDEAAEQLLLDGVAALELGVVAALLGRLLGWGLFAGALLNGGGSEGSGSESHDGEDVLGKHVGFGLGFGIGNPKS